MKNAFENKFIFIFALEFFNNINDEKSRQRKYSIKFS